VWVLELVSKWELNRPLMDSIFIVFINDVGGIPYVGISDFFSVGVPLLNSRSSSFRYSAKRAVNNSLTVPNNTIAKILKDLARALESRSLATISFNNLSRSSLVSSACKQRKRKQQNKR
jgi:hypothetical protein